MTRVLFPGLAAIAVAAGIAAVALRDGVATPAAPSPDAAPVFVVDPFWPKPLPNDWIVGQVSGVAVDADDHVWVLHRPATLTAREAGAVQEPPLSECCVPAPPVLEFDAEGNLLRAWGGKGGDRHWPDSEHTLAVDGDGNIWIGSNGRGDNVVQKYSPDGELLLQIGEPGRTGGSNDTTLLGSPAGITIDDAANEVYIADGYRNRRVIVFDATTGAYKRHWGAYGEPPADGDLGPYDPDATPARQFRSPVHAVRIDREGQVFVADRVNNRIQVFRKDGTFVKEAFVAPRTLAMGSVWDIAFSHDPEQTWIYVPDGTNQKVWVLRRTDLEVIGAFGRGGRNAGQFGWVHNLAVASNGDIYTTEVDIYKRVQKFRYQGTTPIATAADR